MTPTSCLLVCERRGTWAAAMRRHLPPEIRLRETRSLAECAGGLVAAPASVVAVELTTTNLAGVLKLASELGRGFPLARLAVLAERGLEPFQWLLREAGAVHFTTSPRRPQELVRLVQRHAERIPRPRTSFAAQIWDWLPWHEAAKA